MATLIQAHQGEGAQSHDRVPVTAGLFGDAARLWSALPCGGDLAAVRPLLQELAYHAPSAAFALGVHFEIARPLIIGLGTPPLRRQWESELHAGRAVAAVAVAEHGSAADLGALRTTATLAGDGSYVLRGHKRYVSNGPLVDLLVVLARVQGGPADGRFAMLAVDTRLNGVEVGDPVQLSGLRALPISDIVLDDVVVDDTCVLGRATDGLAQLGTGLVRERVVLATLCAGAARRAVDTSLGSAAARQLRSGPLAELPTFQNAMGEIAADLLASDAMLALAVAEHDGPGLSGSRSSLVKLWCSQMHLRVIRRCADFASAEDVTSDAALAAHAADARVLQIAGGANSHLAVAAGQSVVRNANPQAEGAV